MEFKDIDTFLDLATAFYFFNCTATSILFLAFYECSFLKSCFLLRYVLMLLCEALVEMCCLTLKKEVHMQTMR